MKEKLTYFNALKTKVIEQFLANNTLSHPNHRDWTGQEITLFQEDFIQKVKSGFSEKWFYTYFKNDSEKPPRIDMLNLMSQYVGFKNFNEFRNSLELQDNQFDKEKNTKFQEEELPVAKAKKSSLKKQYLWLLGLILVLIGLSFSFFAHQESHFTFCFVEKSNGLPPKTPLRITILLENESPRVLQTDKNSCFEYISKDETIRFVVQSTFHEPDTIVRKISSGEQEQIPLKSNDYALMLRYYTSSNTENWKKRRDNLDKLIADNAQIYRLYPQQGISVYSKSEFIDQLTLPTKNLNNIEIIESQYFDNQIVKLKFKVTE